MSKYIFNNCSKIPIVVLADTTLSPEAKVFYGIMLAHINELKYYLKNISVLRKQLKLDNKKTFSLVNELIERGYIKYDEWNGKKVIKIETTITEIGRNRRGTKNS